MRPLKRIILFFMGSTYLFLSACSIDEDLAKPTISPDYILPLVYGDLDLKNLVKDTSFIKTDPSGYLKVGFADTLEVLNSTSLADALGIVTLNVVPPTTLTFTPNGGNELFPTEASLDVNLLLGLSKIKTMAFHNANFKVIIQNQKSYAFNGLVIKIPGLEVNGTPYESAPMDVPAGQTFEHIVNVGESIWDLTGKPGGVLDTSFVYFQFSSATPITGPAGGAALITMQFIDKPAVKYWQGKSTILQQVLSNSTSTSQTSNLVPADTYKGIKSGSLGLKGIDVKLNFKSNMGIPLGMNLILETKNGVTGQKVAMTPLDVNIGQASLSSNEPVAKDNLDTLNETTSNLADVLTNFPTTIKVTAGVGSTFDNPDPLAYFFHENSDLNLYVDATIPLAVSFNQLRLESVKPFALFETFKIDTSVAVLDTGVFYFKIRNGFPYDIDISLNALTALQDSVAQLAVISMVGATTAIVNGEERVVSPSTSSFSVALSQNLFEKLKIVKNLGIKAKINTTADSPKIYTDYKLGFDVKARVKVTATPIK